MTIYPVTAIGRQHRSFAEALGLVIEKSGFRGIKLADVAFRPEETPSFDEISLAFGESVAAGVIETEYALYSEFLGTPESGVEAVRTVLVDKGGQIVWKDVQTSRDADFERLAPRDPMGCCQLVSQRLRPLLVMAPPGEQRGEMEKLWARKSGTPDEKELETMKLRRERMRTANDPVDVVVYPVRVGATVDREGAADLVSRLNDEKLFRARVASEPLWFEVPLNSNEQRMLWDMSKAFQAHLRTRAPEAAYALYCDYIREPGGGVWAVHFVVCRQDGEFVIVDFQNNHHGDFAAISPRSTVDCNRLTTRRLRGYLR